MAADGTLVAVRSTGQTVHYEMTVTPHASEVQYLQTDPGTVVTGTTKRSDAHRAEPGETTLRWSRTGDSG